MNEDSDFVHIGEIIPKVMEDVEQKKLRIRGGKRGKIMIDQKIKEQIDAMSQEELCRKWRFAIPGDLMLQGEEGEYFAKRLTEKGGFTPEISKRLGW